MMKYSDNIFLIAKNKNQEELFEIYLYLERYINDGSPSGFDLGLPLKYSPFYHEKFIDIFLIKEDWTKHLQIGKIPNSLNTSNEEIPFLIHPIIAEEIFEFEKLKFSLQNKISAQPTASGRTVLWEDESKNKWFIKLHFPKKLGRFNRELNLFRWLSILERSRELYSAVSIFPKTLSFLHDLGGTFYQNQNSELSFGTIFRESTPKPLPSNKYLLIPSFSLFASKRNDGRKQSILADMIEEIKMNDEQFHNLLIFPLIDAYIFLVDKLGMIPEFNAQNLLYEYDLVNHNTRIVIRDVGDCFIDFIIRERENLHTNFCSYKTLDPLRHNDIFQRRSFAFDFKLSHYILLPLLEEYSKLKGIKLSENIAKVKAYFVSHFPNHKEYFNSIKWFSYPNKEGVNRSSYIENDNPLFR